ncbi:MAG TPA: translocation/assembly module TamB domain-containing protein [Moraxellaceae bacterium]
MWRHHALRIGRGFWRGLLWLGLLLLVILVPTLVMLGSEGGSRWLLERGLGMQRAISASYQSGSLLSGLELRDVHFQNSKFDLRVRHMLARWSLLQLFLGSVDLKTLQAEGVSLRLLSPPTGKPTQLPILVLPIRLHIQDVQLRDMQLFTYQAVRPLTLEELRLAGRWQGYRLRLARLSARQEKLGDLGLSGRISLRGGYPLELQGKFDYLAFRQQGWQPLQLKLTRELADLELALQSQGPLTGQGVARIKPLEPALPYSVNVEWQPVQLPWWPQQQLASKGGQVQADGDKTGLRSVGQAQLSGRQLPAGDYAWKGKTNWHSADFESFDFKGLLGKVKANGHVGWQGGFDWKLKADFQQLDLARQWPVPRIAVPVMTGKLESDGRTSSSGSGVKAVLRLANGESWDLQEKGRSWLWDIHQPQEVKLQWRQVRRVLPGLQSLSSTEGELEFRGDISDYSLLLETGLESPRLPAGQWSAELSGADRHVNVERLDYQGEAGELGFGGEVDFGPTISWQGALVLSDFSTGWLLPDWSGQFTGHLAGAGEWGNGRRDVRIQDSYVTGQLRDKPLLLDGPVSVSLPPAAGWPQAQTPGLRLVWGADQVDLKGGVQAGVWDLQAGLQLGDLAQFEPRLQGALNGAIKVTGAERQPDIDADLQASKAGVAALRLRDASLQLRLRQLGQADSTAAFLVDGVTNSEGRDLGQLALEFSGRQDDHRLQWQAGGDRIHGQGSVEGAFDPSTLSWKGRMETGQVSLPEMDWLLSEATALEWDGQEKQLLLAEHCWISLEARLCSDGDIQVGPVGAFHLALTGLQAERLAQVLPEGLLLTGAISGRADGGWERGQRPQATAELKAEGGKVELARDEPQPPLELPYEKVALSLKADAQSLGLRFDLLSQSLGQGHIEAGLDPYAEHRTMAGTLALQGLRLDVFQPFFPALATLAGSVSADGRLQGTLEKPEFWGNVQLARGELGLHRLPVNLHDVTARIDVKGNAADISGAMKSGQGTATVAGKADWATEKPTLDLAIKGERFELKQEPQLLAEINPDLRLQVEPGQVDINGQIVVPTGRLNLKPLTDKAVPLSSDVRIVSTAEGDRAQVAAAMANWLINADILVRLGDDVFFHGYGVNGRLLGALRLRQQGRKGLEANGEVELDKDSRYDAYGQRLQIRRGRLIFAGNLTQPGLDVEAVREVDSKVVGVRVEGRANTPEVSFFSDDGGLSQEEILSYLVLGRPLDTSSGKEGPNLSAAAAAIKLGATGGAGLTSQLGDSLGITDLSVDAEGSGDDTQFTVSGYLSPKLYLRYGVGIFTPVNTATIRYKINSKIYLEAVSSLDSAIDIFYNLKF